MYTFDPQTVSDLHKEAFGFRPSSAFYDEWRESTDDQKQATWDWLLEAAARRAEDEAADEARALEDFEKELASIIKIRGCQHEIDALVYMTPIEFDERSDELDRQDVEHWVWQYGILFTDRGRSVVNMVCSFYNVRH